MVSAERMLHLSQGLRARFQAGTRVNVLPRHPNHMADAARMAGLAVTFRPAALWPCPGLIHRLSQDGLPGVQTIGKNEIARHNAVRDYIANGLRTAPNGAAIIEVRLVAEGSQIRADADIVSRGARAPGAAQQAFFEIKTGTYSEIRPNQQYVYALTLVGGHVTSYHPGLPTVGLPVGASLPAMDFVLMDVLDDGTIEPALILASQVDRTSTLEQLMAFVAVLESRR